MALRYSFELNKAALLLEDAVEYALSDGVRTADLMLPDLGEPVSTTKMCDAIFNAMDEHQSS